MTANDLVILSAQLLVILIKTDIYYALFSSLIYVLCRLFNGVMLTMVMLVWEIRHQHCVASLFRRGMGSYKPIYNICIAVERLRLIQSLQTAVQSKINIWMGNSMSISWTSTFWGLEKISRTMNSRKVLEIFWPLMFSFCLSFS